jgi:hypothetical protein
MADRENIRDRIRRINPKALEVMDILDKECRKLGCTGATVTVTEDMTSEEEEMALFEGFLKEGYPPDIAKEKTALFLDKIKRFEERARDTDPVKPCDILKRPQDYS